MVGNRSKKAAAGFGRMREELALLTFLSSRDFYDNRTFVSKIA